ncbi:hypothetical protein J3459_008662 [Metarhizium acridum]|nr:hypothetical protein J3459_008662 [Metarhizium acridum]
MPASRPQRLRQADPAAVADRARSRGWKADKHVENDKLRDLNQFDDKAKEKHDRVLNKYAINFPKTYVAGIGIKLDAYWHRDADAIRHIEQVHGRDWFCAECNFSSDSKQSGLYHLHGAHGYNIPNTTSVRTQVIDTEFDSKAHASEVKSNVLPCGNIFESLEESSLDWASSSRSPESSYSTNYTETYLTTPSTMLDSQFLARGGDYSDTCTETFPGDFYELSESDTASFRKESPDLEPLDELMSKYMEFPPDTTQPGMGKVLPAVPSKTCEVVDVTTNEEDFSLPIAHLADDQRQSKHLGSNAHSDSSTWLDTSILQPLPATQASEQDFPKLSTARGVVELAMPRLKHEESKAVARPTSRIGSESQI